MQLCTSTSPYNFSSPPSLVRSKSLSVFIPLKSWRYRQNCHQKLFHVPCIFVFTYVFLFPHGLWIFRGTSFSKILHVCTRPNFSPQSKCCPLDWVQRDVVTVEGELHLPFSVFHPHNTLRFFPYLFLHEDQASLRHSLVEFLPAEGSLSRWNSELHLHVVVWATSSIATTKEFGLKFGITSSPIHFSWFCRFISWW